MMPAGCAYMGREEDKADVVSPVPMAPLPPGPAVEPNWTPPPVEYKTYTVKKGDTLSGIAYRYGVRVAEIVEINRLPDPNRIRSGLVIKLPAHARPAG